MMILLQTEMNGGNTMKSKKEKREEALARLVKYESMTIQDRLNRLDKYGFVAKKERAKLKKQLEV
jgi:hypothetical protein